MLERGRGGRGRISRAFFCLWRGPLVDCPFTRCGHNAEHLFLRPHAQRKFFCLKFCLGRTYGRRLGLRDSCRKEFVLSNPTLGGPSILFEGS